MDIKPTDIVTEKSFENAIIVHAAISGSSNTLLHLPAIAKEIGFELSADKFDEIHRKCCYILNIRLSGEWPAQYFYYAGGLPAVMEEIKDTLHLDVMTVTGKTLGENLEELKTNGYYEKCNKYLKKVGLKKEDIIKKSSNPIKEDGAIAILKGNLAPEGAVIKHSSLPNSMRKVILKARPFDCEEDALNTVLKKKIKKGKQL